MYRLSGHYTVDLTRLEPKNFQKILSFYRGVIFSKKSTQKTGFIAKRFIGGSKLKTEPTPKQKIKLQKKPKMRENPLISMDFLCINFTVDLWCRWPESNRHGIATGGFCVLRETCLFLHIFCYLLSEMCNFTNLNLVIWIPLNVTIGPLYKIDSPIGLKFSTYWQELSWIELSSCRLHCMHIIIS